MDNVCGKDLFSPDMVPLNHDTPIRADGDTQAEDDGRKGLCSPKMLYVSTFATRLYKLWMSILLQSALTGSVSQRMQQLAEVAFYFVRFVIGSLEAAVVAKMKHMHLSRCVVFVGRLVSTGLQCAQVHSARRKIFLLIMAFIAIIRVIKKVWHFNMRSEVCFVFGFVRTFVN
ncbi:unnamed protein product [Prunus armeniaca]|uniref:Uncharacterized protein n=1 Tax=Prunus armeniaca TaxID=36596 RepID=A0A6J5UL83_PRUAR|nr:unnamed protein product [Prunus armeniaca]